MKYSSHKQSTIIKDVWSCLYHHMNLHTRIARLQWLRNSRPTHDLQNIKKSSWKHNESLFSFCRSHGKTTWKQRCLKPIRILRNFIQRWKKKNLRQLIVFLITFRFPIESSQEIVDNLHCYVPLLINETVVLIRVFTLLYQFITLVKFLWLRLKDIVVLTPNNRHFV